MVKLYFKASNFTKVRHTFWSESDFQVIFFNDVLFLFSASPLLEQQQTLETYQKLLTYTKSAVTRNYSEKSINNMLDNISSSNNMDFLEKFYASTLQSLEESKNDVSFFSVVLSFFLHFFCDPFLFFVSFVSFVSQLFFWFHVASGLQNQLEAG